MSVVVGIRANGGPSIGFGHIRRCLSLAEALLAVGSEVVFLVNPESAPEQWMPHRSEARVERLPADEVRSLDATSRHIASQGIDALVVDSYDAGETALKTLSVPTVVLVDSPPARALPVRLVVDSSPVAAHQVYPLRPGSRALLGLDYVLLRSDVAPGRSRRIKDRIEHMLVTTGAGDELGLSPRLVGVARRAIPAARVTVVAGPYFPRGIVRALEQNASADDGICVVRSPETLAALMLEADVAIAAGGQTTYELAATGTPACAVRMAPNQTGNLTGLAARGTLEWVGDASDPGVDIRLEDALRRLAVDRPAREKMSDAGRTAVDGQGASRIAREVLGLVQ